MLLPTLEIERKIITNLTEVKKKPLKNGMTINSTPQIKQKILSSITYQKTRKKNPNDQEPTQGENSSHQ